MAEFGGQKGLSIVGEPMVAVGGLVFILTLSLLSNFGFLSCSTPTPDERAAQEIATFNGDCVKADNDRRRGEDYNETLLKDPKCREYLKYAEVEEAQDQANELDEDAPTEADTQQASEPHVDENGYTILEVEP